jgi:hypothetical protein
MARKLENIAPAYQEVKLLHREHIGTGNKGDADETNMKAQEYRDMQRGLIANDNSYNLSLANRGENPIGVSSAEKENAVSNAAQINQLGYGQILRNRRYSLPPGDLEKANKSYEDMVWKMQNVTYQKDANTSLIVSVAYSSQLEMILARYAAITGNWPSDQAIKLNKLLEQYENKNENERKIPEREIEEIISTLRDQIIDHV